MQGLDQKLPNLKGANIFQKLPAFFIVVLITNAQLISKLEQMHCHSYEQENRSKQSFFNNNNEITAIENIATWFKKRFSFQIAINKKIMSRLKPNLVRSEE